VTINYLRKGEQGSATIKPALSEIFLITRETGKKETQSFAGNEEFKKTLEAGSVRVDGKPIRNYDEFLSDIEKSKGRSVIMDIKESRYEGKIEIAKKQ
jgi:hypothetical protein